MKAKSALPVVSEYVQRGLLQRKCACGQHSIGGACTACRTKHESTLQRAAISSTVDVNIPPVVDDVLNSSGQPLDAGTRAFMEPRFGHDFSNVRVHTDDRAAESAQTMGALAYTVGSHVVFGPSRYASDTTEGKRLLAHELAHVVQQQSAPTTLQRQSLGEADNPSEIEADHASERVLQNQQANIQMTAPATTPQFGIIGCSWYLWRFSKIIDECSKEYEQKCGEDMLTDECAEFMDGAGYPSDSILKCVGRKNPKVLAKLLSSCSTVSLGRILKGVAPGMGLRSSNEPQNDEDDSGMVASQTQEDTDQSTKTSDETV